IGLGDQVFVELGFIANSEVPISDFSDGTDEGVEPPMSPDLRRLELQPYIPATLRADSHVTGQRPRRGHSIFVFRRLPVADPEGEHRADRKSTRLNSS